MKTTRFCNSDFDRVIAIGDVHGNRAALDRLLETVEPSASDLMVFLGDYVDRGPDARGSIERILALRRDRNVVCLRGNHEDKMLAARRGGREFSEWLDFGGRATLESYSHGDRDPCPDAVPAHHWDFIEDCLDGCESGSHIFVHGMVDAGRSLSEQDPRMVRWTKLWRRDGPHGSGRTVVCGHTAQRGGVPFIAPGYVCIDSCVYETGWLTAFDVLAGVFIQAHEDGTVRRGTLAAPPGT